MKLIKNGKIYNTETADEICREEYSNCGDFRWYCDTLYKTKKGQYFMHGEGGPLSHYAVTEGGSSSGGSEMFLVSEEKAKEFIEKGIYREK